MFNTNNTSYQNEYSGIFEIASSNIEIINSIFWNNAPRYIINVSYGDEPLPPNQISILNSDIEGDTTWTGESNINLDPLFTDSENDDYTLHEGSPCIDAGTVIEDMDYCGEAPDMGAYEYITEDCYECDTALGDVNGDSQINILDLVQISYYILEISTPNFECAADFNEDGQVNILDLVQITDFILDN